MKEIKTDNAPKALGPYSQAIVEGNFIFCSGQIAIDPKQNTIIAGGIKEQTKQALQNIREILLASDSDLNHIVKTEVYLKNINDFKEMNEVYESVFTSRPYPARATVEVSHLPKDALIEISCIAYTTKYE